MFFDEYSVLCFVVFHENIRVAINIFSELDFLVSHNIERQFSPRVEIFTNTT